MARKGLLDQHDGSRSGAHRYVERILTEMRIAYMSECEEFHPYRLDIYLPEWHAAIEVDGPGHTSKRDDHRDAQMLNRYHVKTYRMRSDRIVKQADIKGFLVAAIEDAAKDSDERRHQYVDWLTSQ